ncbi:MAG: hypothetical protein GX295_03885 [Syntrophomonadaceae bacterium]|nr:hypothetical protein [Syntrophomonadaceae bacterium]
MFKNWKLVLGSGLTALALCLICLLVLPGKARATDYSHPFPEGFWNVLTNIFVEDLDRDWNGDGQPDGTDRFGGIPNDGLLEWPVGIHHVGGNNLYFHVPENCRLVIPAGSTVVFNEGSGGGVGGTLVANGTAEQPIVFTCSKKEKGAWGSLSISKTAGPETILNHCTIEYGGEGDWCLLSVYGDNDPQGPHPTPTITNCRIRNSSTVGLKIHFDANPIIRNCRFEDNNEWPIAISNSLKAYSFEGCTASGNGTSNNNAHNAYSVWMADNVGRFENNTGSGNGSNNDGNRIIINTSTMTIPSYISPTKNLTLYANTIPYWVEQHLTVGNGLTTNLRAGVTATFPRGISLNSGTLELNPGSTVKMGKDSLFNISNQGTLLAQGTAAQNVLITSAEANPARGDWSGIGFMDTASADSRLDYTTVEYGGKYYSGNVRLGWNWQPVPAGTPIISNCTIRYSSSAGISVGHASTPVIQNCRIENNEYGITTDDARNEGTGSQVTLTASPGNTFTGNAQYDISNGFHGGTIDARNNNWGTADTAVIDQRIFDKNDDAQYGLVQYLPLAGGDGGDWKDFPEKTNQPTDKVWTITFSHPVAPNTVNSDTVYVALDPAGLHKITGIKPVVNPTNNAQVLLSPPTSGWPAAQTCYIIVSNSVQAADDRKLTQGVRLKFNTK